MEIEEKIKAVRNRDKSYRYKFFVAVKTTKIVCTPDCPAKPLEKNIVFYDTLNDALQTGYRPCKICMKEQMDTDTWKRFEKSMEALEERLEKME